LIRDLDTSLRRMLVGEAVPASELATATISFAVPDKDWRGQGTGLDLDVYLYRVIDNRELRSNAHRPVYNVDGSVTSEIFPSRIECSYIISAWNKATPIPGQENELQEHRLLSQVFYVLWRNPTMPSKYLVGLLANAEIALPLVAGESEDMAAKPDFWSAIDSYVRPAITCRVTIALDLDLDVTGPMMTSESEARRGRERIRDRRHRARGARTVRADRQRVDPTRQRTAHIRDGRTGQLHCRPNRPRPAPLDGPCGGIQGG